MTLLWLMCNASIPTAHTETHTNTDWFARGFFLLCHYFRVTRFEFESDQVNLRRWRSWPQRRNLYAQHNLFVSVRQRCASFDRLLNGIIFFLLRLLLLPLVFCAVAVVFAFALVGRLWLSVCVCSWSVLYAHRLIFCLLFSHLHLQPHFSVFVIASMNTHGPCHAIIESR